MTALLRRLFGDPEPCRGDWRESKLRGNCGAPPEHLGWPLQPLNTWSNLAYLAAGIVLVYLHPTAEAVVQALALTLLWIGSSLYHGWPTRVTNRLDHAGMGATFFVLFATSIGWSWPLLLLVGALAAAFHVAVRPDANLVVGGLLLATLAVQASPGLSDPGVWSLLAFLLAFFAWMLDRREKLLGRYGHKIWHLGTAVALLLMALSVRV